MLHQGYKSKSQKGAVLAEYALALAIFIGTFITAGILLERAARTRSNMSIGAVQDIVPCIKDETNDTGNDVYIGNLGSDPNAINDCK